MATKTKTEKATETILPMSGNTQPASVKTLDTIAYVHALSKLGDSVVAEIPEERTVPQARNGNRIVKADEITPEEIAAQVIPIASEHEKETKDRTLAYEASRNKLLEKNKFMAAYDKAAASVAAYCHLVAPDSPVFNTLKKIEKGDGSKLQVATVNEEGLNHANRDHLRFGLVPEQALEFLVAAARESELPVLNDRPSSAEITLINPAYKPYEQAIAAESAKPSKPGQDTSSETFRTVTAKTVTGIEFLTLDVNNTTTKQLDAFTAAINSRHAELLEENAGKQRDRNISRIAQILEASFKNGNADVGIIGEALKRANIPLGQLMSWEQRIRSNPDEETNRTKSSERTA